MAVLLRKLKSLIEVVKTVKNWFSVLLLYTGLRKNVVVAFRNGITVEITDKSRWHIFHWILKISLRSRILQDSKGTYKIILGDTEVVLKPTDEDSLRRAYVLSGLHKELNIRLYPERNFCEFYFKRKKIVYFFNLKDFTAIYTLYTTFVDDIYGALNVRGNVVADIGAGYGDTAIYFALKGARKVHAYEPIPWVAETLEKNVSLNNLSDIVKIYPYAVSFNGGTVTLIVPKSSTGTASLYYDDIFKSIDKNIEVICIQKVTPPVDADVAKIDCEGCEYDIILRWLKNRIYDEIVLEYHRGYGQLVRKLRGLGYKVEFLKKESNNVGLLYAYAR